MVISITPVMLTLSVLSKSLIFIHSDGPIGRARPALFTKPQSPGKLRTKMSNLFLKPLFHSLTWNTPLSPTSFLVHSTAFWMLAVLVTSKMQVFRKGPVALFRSSAPFSVRHPARTRKPRLSRRLHSRCPKPESQPVTKTCFSETLEISRLSR